VNGATGVSSSSVPFVSRGSVTIIYGTNLSSTIASSNGFPLPTQLGGTQVFFGTFAAPLLYVSPGQVNLQVPFEIEDVSAVDLVVQNGSSPQQPSKSNDPGAGSRDFTLWLTRLAGRSTLRIQSCRDSHSSFRRPVSVLWLHPYPPGNQALRTRCLFRRSLQW
jgi:hypothetical protein